MDVIQQKKNKTNNKIRGKMTQNIKTLHKLTLIYVK